MARLGEPYQREKLEQTPEVRELHLHQRMPAQDAAGRKRRPAAHDAHQARDVRPMRALRSQGRLSDGTVSFGADRRADQWGILARNAAAPAEPPRTKR